MGQGYSQFTIMRIIIIILVMLGMNVKDEEGHYSKLSLTCNRPLWPNLTISFIGCQSYGNLYFLKI